MNNDINISEYLVVKFGEMAMVVAAAISVYFICTLIYNIIYERD